MQQAYFQQGKQILQQINKRQIQTNIKVPETER